MNHIQEKPLFSLGVSDNSVLVTAGCFDPKFKETESVYDQAMATFSVLDGVLAEAGLDKSNVMSASVWLPLRETCGNGPTIAADDAAEFNKAWNEYWGELAKPARDTVGVGFVFPEFLCEIKFIASHSKA
ncbi:RidA family protein [Vibrio superstes]|nr:RidA family protein [Vibrio superstes]